MLRLVYRLAPRRLYRGLARQAAALRPRLVVDIGGGAGLLAAELAAQERGPGLILVVDPDTGLLADAPSSPLIERVAAVAEHLPLRSGSADVAVFHDSLHHIPHPEAALVEAARVSRCVLVDDFDTGRLAGRLVALMERLSGYPASFLPPSRVGEILEGLGLRRVSIGGGSLPATYRLLACREGLES